MTIKLEDLYVGAEITVRMRVTHLCESSTWPIKAGVMDDNGLEAAIWPPLAAIISVEPRQFRVGDKVRMTGYDHLEYVVCASPRQLGDDGTIVVAVWSDQFGYYPINIKHITLIEAAHD